MVVEITEVVRLCSLTCLRYDLLYIPLFVKSFTHCTVSNVIKNFLERHVHLSKLLNRPISASKSPLKPIKTSKLVPH